MSVYSEYQERIKCDMINCIEAMECLPILFVGSGLSKRYFDAPNWKELLSIMAENNPISKPFAFYKQNFTDNSRIGSELAKEYNTWAWNERKAFSDDLYLDENNLDIFLKSKIVEYLVSHTPDSIEKIDKKFHKEIQLLRNITPHAIITTNYDTFLETLFPDYSCIIGQEILKTQYQSIGEIFKIHGCCSNPRSLVLTDEDYKEFIKKKKYLTAKLLTYFLEHPIIILGYSISDKNIQSILSDIDEILATKEELVSNIYIVEWLETIDSSKNYSSESLIQLENGNSLRVKKIVTSDLDWIFDTLSIQSPIEKVNPKLLRALLSRTYELIRRDVPKRTVEINYDELKSALENKNEIAKIYGITTLVNPKAINIEFPYSLTEVGQALGYPGWHDANKLLEQIKQKTGQCIKDSDNRYHIGIPGTSGQIIARKYSQELINLLRKVADDQDYDLNLVG